MIKDKYKKQYVYKQNAKANNTGRQKTLVCSVIVLQSKIKLFDELGMSEM